VLGTVGDVTRAAAATRAGYDAAHVRGPDLTSAIRERTGGRPIDLVLDPQGTALLDLDLDVVAAGGRIVLFGNASGATLDPLPDARRLFAANASIAGFSLAALAARAPGRVAGAMHDVLNHLAAGELDIELTLVDGLDAAPQAQQALAEGRGRGKQIVRVTAT
jgi:NADPH2:quinone reductase